MSYLDPYPDPFFDILRLDLSHLDRKQINDPVINELSNSFLFPDFKFDQISQAEKQYQSDKSYTHVIRTVNFNFAFYPQSLQIILRTKLNQYSIHTYDFCCVFVLYSYISWITMYEKIQTTEYITLLLGLINYLLLMPVPNQTYCMLLQNCFFHIISKYIESGSPSDFRIVLE